MRGKGVVFLIVSHTAENAAPVFRILALAPARRNRQRRCHLPSLLLSVGSDSSTTFHRESGPKRSSAVIVTSSESPSLLVHTIWFSERCRSCHPVISNTGNRTADRALRSRIPIKRPIKRWMLTFKPYRRSRRRAESTG